MDLRIVNTCNNDCLYCLESDLRNKEKFISKDLLFKEILVEKNRDNITFYGGNSLLHPELLDIIKFCKLNGFNNIGLLSNTMGIEGDYLQKLQQSGLNNFGLYFNSFNKEKHELVNGTGIKYNIFLENLEKLFISGLHIKVIIHINKLNINTISRDLILLKEKYRINNFDFVNYFPFDKPYKNRKILEYRILEYRGKIDILFKIIKKLNLKVKFVKFSKDFFGDCLNFYDYEKGIVNQVGKEDIERLSGKEIPFCFKESRCDFCFLKDNCKYYGL